MIMPTYSLLLSLASFNIQLAISKEISSGKRSKTVISNSIIIMIILNIILITLSLILSKFISINLLHNKDTLFPLIAATLTLPFVSIGYIIKGYFYGKQNVLPHMLSNVAEQLIKLILILLILPLFKDYSTSIQVTIFILLNIITETSSCLIMYLFLPKYINLKTLKIKYDKDETKSLLNITLPSTSSRLIGNIGYFFEPIILTFTLLKTNYTKDYITKYYGIYNAYTIQTLLVPSFFISAISQSLIPEISRLYKTNNIKTLKKRIIESITLSLLIGITFTTLIVIFKDKILLLLFNTNEGSSFINILAPFFILFYLESPISSILISLNKIKQTTFITTSGIIIKTLILFILGLLGFGIYSLIISEIINIIYVTLLSSIILIYFINNI